jgi:hypothetical protein
MKTALVIGNGEYQNTAKLRNTKNDAKDVANFLESVGFRVSHFSDLELEEFEEEIERFGKSSLNSEIALFYFAGHGLQSGGRNFLVPTDAKIKRDKDISKKSIGVDEVLHEMELSGAKLNLVILDSCRDNPFEDDLRSFAKGRNVAYEENRGLANPKMVRSKNPTLLIYPTEAGEIARDFEYSGDRNGLYTKYLLEAMREPHQNLYEVFDTVTSKVKIATRNEQIPKMYGSLEGSGFAFVKREIQIDDKTKIIEVLKDWFWKTIRTHHISKWEDLEKVKNLHLKEVSYIPNEVEYLKDVELCDCVNQSQLPYKIRSIREAYISGNIPKTVGKFQELEYLEIGNIAKIPDEIGNLYSLKGLRISSNKISTIPKTVGKLFNLQIFEAWNNRLTYIPEEIGNLSNLKELSLMNTQIVSLPKAIGNLQNLESLFIFSDKKFDVPESIGNLSNLKELWLGDNLESLPETIGNLYNLEELHLTRNNLKFLPNRIGNLHNLKKIDLSHNKIQFLPEEICNLHGLEELNIFGNNLKSLPKNLTNLKNLKKLNLSGNYDSNPISDTERERISSLLPNTEIAFPMKERE